VIRGHVEGQSVGACWHGALQAATKLADGEGWYIRRPHRAFGTQTTVEIVERVLADIVDRFPDIHDLAIGDLSAERGGPISEHSSHQSGRDIDIGLVFTHKPPAYPQAFVVGNAENLDIEATFVLVEEFAKTRVERGGVHLIFLDFDVQKLLYDWALENGETPEYLATLFQYAHGRGVPAGIVRHEPHHADHLHIRFRCPPSDTACR
jgi:murein endopeptidase